MAFDPSGSQIDYGKPEKEKLLRPIEMVVLTQEEFYFWLVISGGFGMLAGFLILGLI